MQEEVPVWWWPVTTLAGSAGLIAVGTVIAWQELNAAPQWGEWEILYSIDDSPRRTIMWGDINNLIFRLKDAATSVGKTCTIDDYRLLRTRPEELIRVEQGLPRTHSPQISKIKNKVSAKSLRWVKDSAEIYWTSTKNFIHSLYYDEESKTYVWYTHDLEDFEELKKDVLTPPIVTYEEFEAKDIEGAKRHVEEEVAGLIEPAHPELVDELVKTREKAYKELKRIARKLEVDRSKAGRPEI